LKWKTVSEYYEDAGINWQVYKNVIGYGITNQWGFFGQFQEAEVGSSLYNRGVAFNANNTLKTFYAQATNGTLPTVSWIMPPLYLSEHAPNTPNDGALSVGLQGSCILFLDHDRFDLTVGGRQRLF
jgi:phospholipase C